ncbi:hypothetical protein HCQ94_00090 [Actinomyces sp. zg-332]|uniref:hypothetical protein n=1 Tax=Actinomyces sp. zg-332 TaxID=2708340 RepID=UPI00142214AB|nr:hypothetical protein [Actinomyces sp. zg-332]QPK94160.1 hypothetical protein HCQ94_00090 [Actinomyces sp. zg-332]
MYSALWKILPGPKWLKAIEALILFGLVVMFLFEWGFPFMVNYLGLFKATV